MFTNFALSTDDQKSFFPFCCSGEHKVGFHFLTGGFFKLPFLSLESYSPFLNKNNSAFPVLLISFPLLSPLTPSRPPVTMPQYGQ